MAQSSAFLLLLSYVAFVSIGLPDTVLGVAWPSLQAAFGVPASAMGAVLTFWMVGYFLSSLGAGAAVSRLGVGGVLSASSALVVAALFGYALAPSWSSFFPLGAVMGLGSGAIDSALNIYAARHFSVRHVNWLHASWGLGASLGPMVMTVAIARGSGHRGGYSALAGALCLMSVISSSHDVGGTSRRHLSAIPQSFSQGTRMVSVQPSAIGLSGFSYSRSSHTPASKPPLANGAIAGFARGTSSPSRRRGPGRLPIGRA